MGLSMNLFPSSCDNVEGLQNHCNIQNIENRCILILLDTKRPQIPSQSKSNTSTIMLDGCTNMC